MSIKNIAILSPGDMGSAVGKALILNGYSVYTNLDKRSTRTIKLSEDAGIITASLPDILSKCEVILSILVPSEALGLATEISKYSSTDTAPYYVDCNATSPITKKTISKIINKSGMKFIDGGIIGPPPRNGQITRLYISGEYSKEILELNDKGIEVKSIGNEIGQASSLKMCYASLTKGKLALYTAGLLAAHRLNIYDSLIEELNFSQKTMLAEMNGVNSLSTKAFRWIGEMEEISSTLGSQETTDKLHLGAAEIFSLVAKSVLGSERPETYDKERKLNKTISLISNKDSHR